MTQTHEKKDNSKKKIGIILLCLLLTVAVIFGSMFAFFSDIISGDTTIKIGTLDLNKGDAEYWKNETLLDGTTGAELDQLLNYNPGDRIVVKIPITNTGSKSAWLRGVVELSGTAFGVLDAGASKFADYFTVYKGNISRADIQSTNPATMATVAAAKMTLTVTDGVGATWTDDNAKLAVINGALTTDAPEIETTSTVPAGTTIYAATGGSVEYTIYFQGAGSLNEWQNKTIKFDYKADAVQFRNNPVSATMWDDLTATPFTVTP